MIRQLYGQLAFISDWPARSLTDCEMRLSETADRLARMPAAPLSVPRLVLVVLTKSTLHGAQS